MAIEETSSREWGQSPETDSSVDRRTLRALCEYMTVLEESEDFYRVVSESGSTYRVDLREPACTCPDFQHRGDELECKHIRRVKLTTGTVLSQGVLAGGPTLKLR